MVANLFDKDRKCSVLWNNMLWIKEIGKYDYKNLSNIGEPPYNWTVQRDIILHEKG